MKIKFIRDCTDKYTGKKYKIGDELVFPIDRAKEILETGYAIEVKEIEEPKEEPKKARLRLNG